MAGQVTQVVQLKTENVQHMALHQATCHNINATGLSASITAKLNHLQIPN